MNVMRNDKVILVKSFENLEVVGMEYEVANIIEDKVVLRDATTKVAVGVVDIVSFGEYFKKPEEVKGWTKWYGLLNEEGDVIASYRTNFKKVQVRTNNGVRSEASCMAEDEFNLMFGIRLAYTRCVHKNLKAMEKECEYTLKVVRSEKVESKNMIKKLLRSLEE